MVLGTHYDGLLPSMALDFAAAIVTGSAAPVVQRAGQVRPSGRAENLA
jgi:hypothetical protein